MKKFQVYLDGNWQEIPKGKGIYNKLKAEGFAIRILWASGKAFIVANQDKAPKAKPKAKPAKAKAKAKAPKAKPVASNGDGLDIAAWAM